MTCPLVVDLDGTLIRSDLLVESGLRFVRRAPLEAMRPLVWLGRGKAVLKARLAERGGVDVTTLPYEPSVLALIDEARRDGRRVVLATASHVSLAEAVARHLGCFDEVIASTEAENLAAERKRDRLVERFDAGGFDYAGNSSADLPVWSVARKAYVVNADEALLRRAHAQGKVAGVLGAPAERHGRGWRDWAGALRMHQWAKNILLFIPLLAAHVFDDPARVLAVAVAFVLFGLCASSVYLLNDLLDLEEDRRHPRKRERPFAAGRLPAVAGLVLSPALLLPAFALAAWLLPWPFVVAMGGYYLLTLAYSLRVKRVMGLDVIALAVLYTFRIVAGAAAAEVPLSFWILAFSMFMFLSLAMLKRYAELFDARASGADVGERGRSYLPGDLEMLAPLGAAAGYLSVLVLALYIHDPATAAAYASPELIWMACPLLLFWVTRMWMLAHRGEMHDDPMVFALRDRTSIAIGVAFVMIFGVAV